MNRNLLVIVGPTAVGKTALSLHLAKQFQGEIISGDSMQVYRGMDIGTAKATAEERAKVPHHLLDLLSPDEAFSVQEFQQLARQTIAEIWHRDHLPILVGGTGLYIEAATYDYQVPPVKENKSLREQLQKLVTQEGNQSLFQKLRAVDPVTADRLHPNDVKRVIRALEVYQATGKPFSAFKQEPKPLYENMLWVGLTMPREQLYQRINQRVDQMLEQGLVEEVKMLRAQGYHSQLTSMQAIGYKEILSYLEGEITLEEAIHLIKKGSRRYAKRQFSWFRRIRNIHWFNVTKNEVSKEIQQFVAGKFIMNRE